MPYEQNLKKSYILLGSSIIISGIFLYKSDSILTNILSLVFLAVCAASIVRFNLSHPFVWYSGFFTLYATGYPILLLFGEYVEFGYSKELIFLHWLALTTFLLIVGPKTVNDNTKAKLPKFSSESVKYIYAALTFVLILFVLFLGSQDFSSKSELASSGSVFVYLGMRAALVYILITTMELINGLSENGKYNFKVVTVTLVVLAAIFFISAERDLLLRYILGLFFLYYIFIYKKENRRKLIAIVVSMAILIPISRSIKYLGMRGEVESIGGNILAEIIKSEFHTQARNVQAILNSGNYEGYFKGETFVTSFTRLFGVSDFSTMSWFNETFFPDRISGVGFSLVGEGYLNFGYLGVVLMFLIIGLVIRTLYLRSGKSIYSMVAYLMMIPISIYTIRADLHNFVSQFTKQVLLILVLVKTMDFLVGKIKNKFNIGSGDVHEIG